MSVPEAEPVNCFNLLSALYIALDSEHRHFVYSLLSWFQRNCCLLEGAYQGYCCWQGNSELSAVSVSCLGQNYRVAILDGFRHIEERTCLKFVQRTTQQYYIRFVAKQG